jgi:hypothetical protein
VLPKLLEINNCPFLGYFVLLIAPTYLKFITFDIPAGNKELANCAAKHKKSKIHKLRIKTMIFLMFPYSNSNPIGVYKNV